MRLLVLLALFASTASEPLVRDTDLLRLNEACESLGGLHQAWGGSLTVHAQCGNGIKVTLHASHMPRRVDQRP
jgi:hypothetical protein